LIGRAAGWLELSLRAAEVALRLDEHCPARALHAAFVDGFADDESSEWSVEGLLRSTGAMHFRSADHLVGFQKSATCVE
jgi:hypothetical protein